MCLVRQVQANVECVATHQTTGWVHQHVVAHRIALGVKALQHTQWPFVLKLGHGFLTRQRVANIELCMPTLRALILCGACERLQGLGLMR